MPRYYKPQRRNTSPRKIFMMILCCGLLSGCGGLNALNNLSLPSFSLPSIPFLGGDKDSDDDRTPDPLAGGTVRTQKLVQDDGSGSVRDLARPVANDSRISVQDVSLTPPPNTDRAPSGVNPNSTTLTPEERLNTLSFNPLGINNQQLFPTQEADPYIRFQRLENTVQQLNNDIQAITPAISRLISVESDLDDLMAQLSTLLSDNNIGAPTPPPSRGPAAFSPGITSGIQPFAAEQQNKRTEPFRRDELNKNNFDSITALNSIGAPTPSELNTQTPELAAPPITQPAPRATVSGPSLITGIRIGEFSDKMRLVIDSSKEIDFIYDYDDVEDIFTLTLPNTEIDGQLDVSSIRGSLIYEVTQSFINDGNVIIITMEAPTEITDTSVIPPSRGNDQFRAYFDFLK